jgi:outer membrane protein assembly factor BamB
VWNFQSTGDFPSITSQVTTPLDWNFGIMWNITIPLPPAYMSSYGLASWSILGADGNYVILDTGVSNYRENGQESFILAGVNVANQPMTTTYTLDIGGDVQHPTAGALAWEENITVPTLDQTFSGGSLQSGGLIVFGDATTQTITAYDESTGHLVWSSTPWNNDFSMQSIGAIGPVAYGMLYNAGYDGYMHAINATTGVQMWDTISRAGGLEMPEPGYPFQVDAVAGNEVFASTNKAYETQPAYRGHCLYAYDATTGAQNWNISGEFLAITIANGILLASNSYDGKEYAFSRGPTATTVSAPQTAITAGQSVVIQGTVTDQTPGITAGTPAISDAWMTPWMEYMYMDQPMPHSAVGVSVSIDAVDPNGNYIHIGNATSDISGTYIYKWTPPDIPGQYTIIASFSADNSYYGSSGETGAVVASPTTAVAPTPTPTSVADMYFAPAIAGIIVAIIIGFVVLALLMLRKRP